MERRIYFVCGDFLTCVLAGAATGWLVQYLIPAGWYLAIALIAGMVLGMLVGMLIALILTPLFGDFELMLPGSLGGMLAGMAVAMLHTVDHISGVDAIRVGVLAGLLAIAYTYVLQARLSGGVEQ